MTGAMTPTCPCARPHFTLPTPIRDPACAPLGDFSPLLFSLASRGRQAESLGHSGQALVGNFMDGNTCYQHEEAWVGGEAETRQVARGGRSTRSALGNAGEQEVGPGDEERRPEAQKSWEQAAPQGWDRGCATRRKPWQVQDGEQVRGQARGG